MARTNSIVIKDVVKRYRGTARDALHQVSLTCDYGVFGLLGPNGAGKTTLMRILATLILPTSGRVTVQGYDVVDKPHLVRSLIGYVPQEYALYSHLTAWEFLDYMGTLSGVQRIRQQVERVLAQVGLLTVARRRLNNFSGGMKQRVVIAQALLHSPQVLLVDEPTAGLDPVERVKFRNLLAELGRERTILLSTHIVEDVSATCKQMAVLHEGCIAYQGSVEDLVALAKGRVWKATIHTDEWNYFRDAHYVISSRPAEQSSLIEVRFLKRNSQPTSNAEPVSPTIEDAYLSLIQAGNS